MKRLALVVCVNLAALLVLLLLFEWGLRAWLRAEPDLDQLRFMPPALRHRVIPDPNTVPELLWGPNQASRAAEFASVLRLVDHDQLGWLHPPHTRIGSAGPTTAEGLLTPDDPAPEERQIIVIGDSFLEGVRNRFPLAWQLRSLVDLPVLNLAAGGWGPGSYLAAYHHFAAGRNAEVVIVFSFVNDVSDATHFRAWEQSGKQLSYRRFLFTRRWHLYSVNTDRRWLDQRSVLYNALKLGLWRSGFIDVNDSRTLLDAKLDDLKRRRRPPADLDYSDYRYSEETVCWQADCLEILMKLYTNRLFLLCDPQDLEPGGLCFDLFDDYFFYMEALHRSITEAGHEMLLVWIPTRERVYFDLLPPAVRNLLLSDDRPVEGAEAIVAGFAARQGIPFLDLTDPLIRAAREQISRGTQLYGAGGSLKDGHFNETGSAVAALAVREFLRAR